MPVSRRRLLRSALAAPALILPGRSLAQQFFAKGVSPAPAKAVGFNTLSFFDDFASTATIDLTNSTAPGFNWYLENGWPNAQAGVCWIYETSNPPATPSGSNISISNSILTLTQNTIKTACFVNNAQGYVGTGIDCSKGFYTEVRMQTNAALRNVKNMSWPFYGMYPLEFLTGAIARWSEFDFVELYLDGNILMGMHDWNTVPNPCTNNQSPNYVVSPYDSNFHIYGVLYLAPQFNGGTGLVQRYYDGTLLSAQTVTFSTTTGASPAFTPANPFGTWSEIQNQHGVLIVSTAFDADDPGSTLWPIKVDYVGVWQSTATG